MKTNIAIITTIVFFSFSISHIDAELILAPDAPEFFDYLFTDIEGNPDRIFLTGQQIQFVKNLENKRNHTLAGNLELKIDEKSRDFSEIILDHDFRLQTGQDETINTFWTTNHPGLYKLSIVTNYENPTETDEVLHEDAWDHFKVVERFSKAFNPNELNCKLNFYPMAKPDYSTIVCVKDNTKDTLIERGWSPISFSRQSEHDPRTASILSYMDKKIIREKVINGTYQSLFVGMINEDGIDQYFYGHVTKDDELINENTVFEIGSISKVFTSLILADMVEKGEVNLDDPIDKFLPENVKTPTWNGQKITLLDLATHTSGLPVMPNYPPNRDLDKEYEFNKEGLYEYLADYKMHREIGSQFEYSNTGGSLLGHVLSLHAGKSYEQILKERILDKLGMDSTCIHQCDKIRDKFAKPHNPMGKIVDEVGLDEDMAGAGAIRSSGKDMLTFLSYAMNLKDSELKESFDLTKNANHDVNEILSIGLGWLIINLDDRKIIWHNGATEGFASYTGFDSSSNTGIIVMTNSQALVDEIGLDILDVQIEE